MENKKDKDFVILWFQDWEYIAPDGVKIPTSLYCKMFLKHRGYHKGLLSRIFELLRRSLTNSLKPSHVPFS